jgi:DNA (cytosine-5)-methyltransferase 1
LAGMGYRTTWCVASASECGAPHQRKRIFILAYRISEGSQGLLRSCNLGMQGGAQSLRSTWTSGLQGCGELADSADNGFDGRLFDAEAIEQTEGHAVARGCPWPSRPGEQQFAWEPPRVCHAIESKMGRGFARVTHRLDDAVLHVSTDNRTDELRLLGNGVVPATAERAFRVLAGELMEATT